MQTKSSASSTIYYPEAKKNNEQVTTKQEILQWEPNVMQKTANTPAFGAYSETNKALHPFYGNVGGTYYAQTGMPWLSSDARKAVLTEWFWQPIRGQPRRVDTNELRKYSQTVWVQAIEQAILNQITYAPYVIVPKKNKGEENEHLYNELSLKQEIETVEDFLETPNKNKESFQDILRAWLKDVLELDAGVIVKVYSLDSFDFEHLEPRSGAPLLKPLDCPMCEGKSKGDPKRFQEKALKTLKAINSMERKLPSIEKSFKEKNIDFQRPDYTQVKEKMLDISQNSPYDENVIDEDRVSRQPETTCPFCNGTGVGRHLTEIYARDGASFLFDVDRTGWAYGAWQYSYSIPAHPMWFGIDEIIYFKQNTRSFSPYGFSAVQSSLDIIKSLEASVQHNKTLFIDGAVPDGIVGIEDMSNEELSRMKNVWENDIKGQPHKVVFVNKRSTFQTFAFNNRDLQFLEGQKEAWNQVIANFNMTPADLGITRDLNRSSASSMTEQTKKKCIKPLMKKIESLINAQLLPELGVSNVEFQFVLDDPSEERQRAEIAEILLRNNLTTPNRILENWGEEPIEGGDSTQADRQAEQMIQNASIKLGNEKDPSHHKPTEIREQRDAASESGKRERESETNKPGASVNKELTWNDFWKMLNGLEKEKKITEEDAHEYKLQMLELEKGYQYPFQAQVPFLTTLQNLSTPVPFALPKQGHPNTMSPYKELNGLCPKCGSEQFAEEPATAGSVNAIRQYRCGRCQAHFNEEEFKQAVDAQEAMHATDTSDPLAPKVGQEVTAPDMMTPNQRLTGNSIDTQPVNTDPFFNARRKKTNKGD